MSSNLEKFEFIGWCSDPINNHDKVWAIIPIDHGRFATVWGRRGKRLQSKISSGYEWDRDSIVNSKVNKGYKKISITQLASVYPEFESDLEMTAIWTLLSA